MRHWINIITETSTPSIDRLMWTFNDWLRGDAMNNINDDGERYSLKPYHDCIAALSKIVPHNRLDALHGMLYRGVQTDAIIDLQVPGPVKTANKRFQSWSPNRKVAMAFARDYAGANGYLFHAEVAGNRRILALSVADVYDWYKTQPKTDSDILYMIESFAHQDEILIRGTTVQVAKIDHITPRRRAR